MSHLHLEAFLASTWRTAFTSLRLAEESVKDLGRGGEKRGAAALRACSPCSRSRGLDRGAEDHKDDLGSEAPAMQAWGPYFNSKISHKMPSVMASYWSTVDVETG